VYPFSNITAKDGRLYMTLVSDVLCRVSGNASQSR